MSRLKDILYGKSGKTLAELHPLHRLTRHVYTWANVKLHGGSWREYKREWMQ